MEPLSVLQLHEISEAGHRILDPLTDGQLSLLGRVARVAPGSRVLDLACGKGEMLCRWAQEFGATGVGVDLSHAFLAGARARAAELGVASAVRFEAGDAGAYRAEVESFDLACCVGATWIGGGVAGTIDLLRPAVGSAGLIIVGEPYWAEPPPPAAYEALGIGPGEFDPLAGLLARFEAAGTDLVEMVLADGASWDRYVAAQWWTLRAWLDQHAGDPRAAQVRGFLDDSRRAYLTYQRRYLGWGVFVLRPGRSAEPVSAG